MDNKQGLDPSTQAILNKIRKALPTRMDGVVSSQMRAYGVDYFINWGVKRQYLVEIADRYEPSKPLAFELMSHKVRELRILATLLYPVTELSESDILCMVEFYSTSELVEQLSFNLLSHSSVGVAWARERLNGIYVKEAIIALRTITRYYILNSSLITCSEVEEDAKRCVALLFSQHFAMKELSPFVDLMIQLARHKSGFEYLHKEFTSFSSSLYSDEIIAEWQDIINFEYHSFVSNT